MASPLKEPAAEVLSDHSSATTVEPDEVSLDGLEALGSDELVTDSLAELPLPDLVTDEDLQEKSNLSSRKAEAYLPDVRRRREIVPHDALSAYLSEVSRYALMTREQEHETAVLFKNNKDVKAAYRLVTSNLWLVIKIAREYEKAARNLLDLIQEGNLGLMEAVKNFDPYRGVRFPSYAVWWVRAYIIRYVIANWRLVKLGTTQSQRRLFFNLKKEKDRLEREGFFAAPKLIADKLNVKESEVIEMEQRLGSNDVSVDAPIQDDGDGNLLSILPAGNESPEESLARRELAQKFQAALTAFAATLNPKEQLILKTRMLAEEKATLQDIAQKLNLSRERIRQLEERIQTKLKVFLEEHMGVSLEEFVQQGE